MNLFWVYLIFRLLKTSSGDLRIISKVNNLYPCKTDKGMTGTCISMAACFSQGGWMIGNCPRQSGLGVCCLTKYISPLSYNVSNTTYKPNITSTTVNDKWTLRNSTKSISGDSLEGNDYIDIFEKTSVSEPVKENRHILNSPMSNSVINSELIKVVAPTSNNISWNIPYAEKNTTLTSNAFHNNSNNGTFDNSSNIEINVTHGYNWENHNNSIHYDIVYNEYNSSSNKSLAFHNFIEENKSSVNDTSNTFSKVNDITDHIIQTPIFVFEPLNQALQSDYKWHPLIFPGQDINRIKDNNKIQEKSNSNIPIMTKSNLNNRIHSTITLSSTTVATTTIENTPLIFTPNIGSILSNPGSQIIFPNTQMTFTDIIELFKQARIYDTYNTLTEQFKNSIESFINTKMAELRSSINPEKFNLSAVCGRSLMRAPKIFGGGNAIYGEFPWQASLRQIKGFISNHKCGAVILHPNWIATAAHCAKDIPVEDMVVRVGVLDLESDNTSQTYRDASVEQVYYHPEFNSLYSRNDIALLKLKSPLTMMSNILPICLPPSWNYSGMMATLTGWGKNSTGGVMINVLQKVDVPILTNRACEEMWRLSKPWARIDDEVVCTGYSEGGRDSCQGDSGGPAQVLIGDRWVLLGIISWGGVCGGRNQPGAQTNIPKFTKWISDITHNEVFLPEFYQRSSR